MLENEEEFNISKEEEEADLKAAEALLAKSGHNGTGYFDNNIMNKRQKTKTQDNGSGDSNAVADKEDDIELMTNLGWVKDKEEAESLLDYSNVSGLKIYDPNAPVSDNPFFSGAAVSGGTLQQNSGKSEKKKFPGRKGRKNNSNGNKSKSKQKSGQK